ncbi:MAG: hypothetical protein Q8O26_15425 [Phreatobacter sp.]|nr:hypothetical protein [Phreatobacter sp.]MDP2803263.1 hypothetical protein [Phreatobacter sp.]
MDKAYQAGCDGDEQDGDNPADVAARLLTQGADGGPVEGGTMVW